METINPTLYKNFKTNKILFSPVEFNCNQKIIKLFYKNFSTSLLLQTPKFKNNYNCLYNNKSELYELLINLNYKNKETEIF